MIWSPKNVKTGSLERMEEGEFVRLAGIGSYGVVVRDFVETFKLDENAYRVMFKGDLQKTPRGFYHNIIKTLEEEVSREDAIKKCLDYSHEKNIPAFLQEKFEKGGRNQKVLRWPKDLKIAGYDVFYQSDFHMRP